VSIVLIRKCHGFDILMPKIYASRFWCLLVKAGAAPVGLDEMEALQHRMDLPSFPRDYPETPAGALFWRTRRDEWAARDAARPPSKRLGAQRWPVFDASALCGEAPFVVPRRRIYLDSLVTAAEKGDGYECGDEEEELPFATMLPVTILVVGRGVVHDGAQLFLPPPEPSQGPRRAIGSVTSGRCLSGNNRRFAFGLVLAKSFRNNNHIEEVHFRNPSSTTYRTARMSIRPSSE